jgi:outer membrane lipoprotein SlyB
VKEIKMSFSKIHSKNRSIALGIIATLVLNGCATIPQSESWPDSNQAAQQNQPGSTSAPSSQPDKQPNAAGNVASGAVAGALAGCALAKLLGKKCADGAAIGAAIGAVIGWSFYSEKVASAQTVNAEATRDGLSVPNNEIRLRQYTLTPSSTLVQAGGNALQVVGDIKLYGQSQRKPEVVQSMLLYTAKGEATSATPQIARIENVDGAGHYRAVGVYKIPRGMAQGQYLVKSTLQIDGKVVARADTRFQVAQIKQPDTLARLFD